MSLRALAVGVFGWLAASPAHADDTCTVDGRVTDRHGAPVAGVHVVLDAGRDHRDAATGSDGRFAFATVKGPKVRVLIALEDRGTKPGRFRVNYERAPAVLATDTFDPRQGSCTRDFDMRHVAERYRKSNVPKAHWAAAVELYQNFDHAWQLAKLLEIEPLGPRPLEIHAWDPDTSPDATYWAGPMSYGSDAGHAPFIALGPTASALTDGGFPDNREYHEFAHHALASAFGAMPRAPTDVRYAGYYKNPSSTDAWTEGFAAFYAMMVAKHIEKRAAPHRLRIGGGLFDLEADSHPFDTAPAESLAVAGVLLDIEDGATIGSPGTVVEAQRVGDALFVGNVPTDAAAVTARFLDATGTQVHVTATTPIPHPEPQSDLALFIIPAPAGLVFDSVVAERVDAPEAPDDDPIDAELAKLWRTLAGFKSVKPNAGGRLFDASDLHKALSAAFGPRDDDGDGRDDIDQIFIAHGLFADLDGDRIHDPGETPGMTSHPQRSRTVDGALRTDPARVPRYRIPLPNNLRARVSTDPADAVVVAHVAFPAPRARHSYAYVAARDEHGALTLSVPPSGSGTTLTLLAVASGHTPAIITRIEADAFWAEAAAHADAFASYTIALTAGELPSATTPAPRPRTVVPIFILGSVLAVLGGLLMISGRRRPERGDGPRV